MNKAIPAGLTVLLVLLGGLTFGYVPTFKGLQPPQETEGQAPRAGAEASPKERGEKLDESKNHGRGSSVRSITASGSADRDPAGGTEIQKSLGSGKINFEGYGPGPGIGSREQQSGLQSGAAGRFSGRGGGRDHSSYSSIKSLGAFLITAYTAGKESTGKEPGDPGYGKTSLSTPTKPVFAQEGRTVSADFKVLPPGTVIEIEGLGIHVVEDSGPAIKGKRLDLFMNDLDKANAWGWKNREVWVIEWGQQ